MRLQSRLLWAVLPLMALAVLVSVTVVSVYSRQTVLDQAEDDGRILAGILGRSIMVSRSVELASEQIISQNLTSTAHVLSQFVAVAEQCKLPEPDITGRLKSLVNPGFLSEIWVTDPEGKAYLHTVPGIDFQFSPDPRKQPQASDFWPLLSATGPAVVVQEMKARETDGRPFKYVGVTGVDRPRIVQVGLDGQSLIQIRKTLGVQELLDHVVKEKAIRRVWLVNPDLEIEAFSDEDAKNQQHQLGRMDRELLVSALEKGTSQTRIQGDFIRIAVPLAAVVNSVGLTGESNDPTEPNGDVKPGMAILIHMTTYTLDKLMERETLLVISTTGIALLLGGLMIVLHTRHMLKPIHSAVAAAERIATGDLSVKVNATGRDEISKLVIALGKMIHDLNTLIGQMQRSTIDLVSTANRFGVTTELQRKEMTQLGNATGEIAAAVRQITATSEDLLNTMAGISEVADETTSLANAGQTSLVELGDTMSSLAESTNQISGNLGLINDKATSISSVITTITRIADQTNILSMNASIEAAKAGTYGLGFAVLAREIRALADQTAVSTLDIEQMVVEMQELVSCGVVDMEQFSRQVTLSVSNTQGISRRFGEIIGHIQHLLPEFEAVHEGMRSQSIGARQIRESMLTLTDTVRISVDALDETSAAKITLENAISVLREEISKFRLG